LIWKTGLFFPNLARLIAIGISGTGLAIVYKIVEMEFSKQTAFYATAILMSSFLYLRWSHYLLTGIPASILVFTSIYFARNRKPVQSGLLASVAFLTRFPAVLSLFAAAVTLALSIFPLKKYLGLEIGRDEVLELFISGFKMGLSFALLPLAYFTLNHFFGQGFLGPMLSGASVPLLNPEKYFYGFYFLKEAFLTNPFLLFAISGVYYVLSEKEEVSYGYLSGLIVFYLFFTFYPHKEARFMILFLPLACLFAAKGLERLEVPFNKRMSIDKEKIFLTIIVAVFLFNSVHIVQMNLWDNPERNQFLKEASKLNGTVAGLHPGPVVYGDFDFIAVRPENYENTSEKAFRKADYFLYNSNAWYCTQAIQNCEEKKQELVGRLNKYNKLFERSNDVQTYAIYRLK
jgi:hypothetical protein